MLEFMDIPLSAQDRQIIDAEYKLATIRDLIEAAEEQGMDWVGLPVDDARWLLEVAGGDVRPVRREE